MLRENPAYKAFNIKQHAERIAKIDNPHVRRHEIEKAPRAFRNGLNDAVGILFRDRAMQR